MNDPNSGYARGKRENPFKWRSVMKYKAAYDHVNNMILQAGIVRNFKRAINKLSVLGKKKSHGQILIYEYFINSDSVSEFPTHGQLMNVKCIWLYNLLQICWRRFR